MNNINQQELYSSHIETLQQRYAVALAAGGFDSVVIAAGQPHTVFLDDQHLPFKPNPHLMQWGPLREHPGSIMIYTPGKRPMLLVYTPEDFWHRVPPVPELFQHSDFDVQCIANTDMIAQAIKQLPKHCAFIGEVLTEADSFGISAANPDALLQALHEQRTRKTDWEVANLREASKQAVGGHRAAEECFASGGSEYAIHLAYRAACEIVDDEMPYPAIVAINNHAATLHYQQLERTATENLSLLLDAGCASNGYASDITRSYSDDPEFGALIEAMHEMQRALCEAALPGVDYRELHHAAHHSIAGLLRDAGIVSSAPEESVEIGLTRVFFPHGLGHFLGLQVHDVGALYTRRQPGEDVPVGEDKYLRLTRVLEAGNVLTIEPGVYFIDTLLAKIEGTALGKHVNWDRVAQFQPFGGIRIEDNLHITIDGNRNLTREAFSDSAQKPH